MSANDNDVDFSRGQQCARNSKHCVKQSNVHDALAMAYRDKSVFGNGYYVEMIGYAKKSGWI